MRITSLFGKVPAAAVSLALVGAVGGATPVSADPVADKRAEAAQIAEALASRARR
ncbi:MAG: hypothetical protein M3396_03830 [Actinomycetota bacterium]|nr:hypothetical protein [Actinomycetota bacterium]